eukprot:9478999-Pyramimonas_sp.AAC.1
MCAVLRREQHFENDPPFIRETLAIVSDGCARRYAESHMLKIRAHFPGDCARRQRDCHILKTTRVGNWRRAR